MVEIGTTEEKREEEKVVFSLIKAAKNNREIAEKLTNILMESLNKEKLKKMIVEEALKDPDLRDQIMLELIKKL